MKNAQHISIDIEKYVIRLPIKLGEMRGTISL